MSLFQYFITVGKKELLLRYMIYITYSFTYCCCIHLTLHLLVTMYHIYIYINLFISYILHTLSRYNKCGGKSVQFPQMTIYDSLNMAGVDFGIYVRVSVLRERRESLCVRMCSGCQEERVCVYTYVCVCCANIQTFITPVHPVHTITFPLFRCSR